jgi:hypothetical protein
MSAIEHTTKTSHKQKCIFSRELNAYGQYKNDTVNNPAVSSSTMGYCGDIGS